MYQARYGSPQVGVGTERGAELASRFLRFMIENPSYQEFMLQKIFEIHSEYYKY